MAEEERGLVQGGEKKESDIGRKAKAGDCTGL